MKHLTLSAVFIVLLWAACGQQTNSKTLTDMKDMESKLAKNVADTDTPPAVVKTEEEWRQLLSPEQYSVLREKGTERPYTGKLLNNKETGTYNCAACGNPLFKSDQKFDSHCGWPSFDDQIPGAIKTTKDTSHGMVRTEITCAKCGSHLGHIFDDGPTETGLRYCVNSLSLDFEKGDTAK